MVPKPAWIELPGPLLDERTGDRQHLGINGIVGLSELWDPNLLGSAQSNEHHPGPSWVDRDHPLAPAHRQAPDPDDPRISHRCPDYTDRLDRHLAVGIKVIGVVEIDRVDLAARD